MSVLPQLLPESLEKRTVAEMGFSVRGSPPIQCAAYELLQGACQSLQWPVCELPPQHLRAQQAASESICAGSEQQDGLSRCLSQFRQPMSIGLGTQNGASPSRGWRAFPSLGDMFSLFELGQLCNDEEKPHSFLAPLTCPSCDGRVSEVLQWRGKPHVICRTKGCYIWISCASGSIFEGSHLSHKQFLYLMYWWVHDRGGVLDPFPWENIGESQWRYNRPATSDPFMTLLDCFNCGHFPS